MEKTFAQEVDAAHVVAVAEAAPFVPSMAQERAALAPLIVRLQGMPYEDAAGYIRATFRGAGSPDAIAVAWFKEERRA